MQKENQEIIENIHELQGNCKRYSINVIRIPEEEGKKERKKERKKQKKYLK